MNTTTRLASLAAAGELLVSVETAVAVRLDTSDLEARTVEVRGRSAPLDVHALRVATPALPPDAVPGGAPGLDAR